MDVRTLAPDHYGEAAALWERTGLTRPWNDPMEDIRRAIDGPASTILAGVSDGKLTATSMVGHDGHRGWAYYVAVAPEYQDKGLGSRMMAAVEEWLRTQGAVKVHLMVRDSNRSMVEFYEHLGYEDSHVVVLAKWLS